MLSAMRHLLVNPPLGGAAGGARPVGPPRGPRAPSGPSAAALALELRPRGNLRALCPPLERPSSLQDGSPTRQALVARPRTAASSCGEVGRRGRFWNPEHGLKQVGSPPRLHF